MISCSNWERVTVVILYLVRRTTFERASISHLLSVPEILVTHLVRFMLNVMMVFKLNDDDNVWLKYILATSSTLCECTITSY